MLCLLLSFLSHSLSLSPRRDLLYPLFIVLRQSLPAPKRALRIPRPSLQPCHEGCSIPRVGGNHENASLSGTAHFLQAKSIIAAFLLFASRKAGCKDPPICCGTHRHLRRGGHHGRFFLHPYTPAMISFSLAGLGGFSLLQSGSR